jgi:hypothetical protein
MFIIKESIKNPVTNAFLLLTCINVNLAIFAVAHDIF